MTRILNIIVILLASMMALWAACSAPATVAPVSKSELATGDLSTGTAGTSTGGATVAPVQTEGQKPAVTQSVNNIQPAETRVEVVYFHAAQRCVTCLCFEEHINTVIDKYFHDAVGKGKLVYSVLNVQAAANRTIAQKYKAVGSQLFINTVMNGVDNIVDVQEIWDWECRTKPASFEEKVKSTIDKYLKTVM